MQGFSLLAHSEVIVHSDHIKSPLKGEGRLLVLWFCTAKESPKPFNYLEWVIRCGPVARRICLILHLSGLYRTSPYNPWVIRRYPIYRTTILQKGSASSWSYYSSESIADGLKPLTISQIARTNSFNIIGRAKIMDDLVTPIKVKLPGDADFTDKLHQSAPICTRKSKPSQ